MSRVYLLVEGQTEEAFVNELLSPHYARMGLYLTPIVVSTSPGHRGGVVSYAKVRPQIERLCRQDAGAHVTTLFDLYALPSDFPGKDSPHTAPSKRIQAAMPGYQKTFHGPLIACDIGLDAIRAACPHFDSWLNVIEGLA